MDEPLSNLDAKLRVQMRAEIARLQGDLGTTTVYVTHDQVEAMTMGDRVAVMRKGQLQQVAPPQELYDHPVNLFVGGFIGSPAMNMLEVTLEGQNGGLRARVGDQPLGLGNVLETRPGLAQYSGASGRPRHQAGGLRGRRASHRPPDGRAAPGRGKPAEALGSEVMVHFTVDAKQALTEDVRELAKDVGEEATAEEAARPARPRSWAGSIRVRA